MHGVDTGFRLVDVLFSINAGFACVTPIALWIHAASTGWIKKERGKLAFLAFLLMFFVPLGFPLVPITYVVCYRRRHRPPAAVDATSNDALETSPTALTRCPDCQREISWRAVNCPGCGAPVSATEQGIQAPPAVKSGRPAQPGPFAQRCGQALGVVICAAVFGYFALTTFRVDFTTQKGDRECRAMIIDQLREPSSATITFKGLNKPRELEASDDALIYHVRARNGFGGMNVELWSCEYIYGQYWAFTH